MVGYSTRFGKKLYHDLAALLPLEAESTDPRPSSKSDAYDAQEGYHAAALENGAGKIGGWKVALTTKTMQEMVGCEEPCEGAIFASRIHSSPMNLRCIDFVNLGVESEIAIRLGADLPVSAHPHTLSSVEAAIGAFMPAIEVIDDRKINYAELDLPLLIALNGLNAALIIGEETTNWRDLKLDSLEGRMAINDKIVARGRSSDTLGHPLTPLVWLANNLNARGKLLNAGDVVSLGSFAPTKWLKPGDQMATVVEKLGEARLSVS